MDPGIASHPISISRNRLPPELLDAAAWPSVDLALIDDKTVRARILRYQGAIDLWLSGKSLHECVTFAQTNKRNFYRIVERCLTPHRDGKIWGFRALIKGVQVVTRVRRMPFKESKTNSMRGGFAGLFTALMRTHPSVSAELLEALLRKKKRAISPNEMVLHEIHKVFLQACQTAGIGATEYPFNTKEKGRRALRNWINTEFLERYAIEFSREAHGDSSANVMQHGAYYEGMGPDATAAPYSEWQLDEYDIDLASSYRFPGLNGDWDEVELSRFSGIRVIETRTGCNLAELVVLAAKPQLQDVLEVLWLAISGQSKKEKLLTPGLQYDSNGGFPAAEIAELKWAVPETIRLDRALIHLSKNLHAWVKECWGGEIKFGRPYDPTERASVETRIGAMATRLLHQLPHTTYSSISEARTRRKKSDENLPFIDAPLLAEAVNVYCANENARPMRGSGQIPPLVRLERLLQASVIKPIYLPQSKRKRHYFSQPIKVTVRVDLAKGRRPYFIYLGVRYTSSELQKRISWGGKPLWIRPDFHDLRTVVTFKENGEEFDVARAQGRWGVVPHDVRIRRLYQTQKRLGVFGERPQDGPLESLIEYLRKKANSGDKRCARSLAYIFEYMRPYSVELSPNFNDEIASHLTADASAQAPFFESELEPARDDMNTLAPEVLGQPSESTRPRRSIVR